MLKMKISDWQNRIDRQIESGLYEKVMINNNIETKEITNFEFCLIPEEIKEKVEPPVEEEIQERDFVLFRSENVYEKYLSQDLQSRRACFVNNYDGEDNHCISYFQHYFRDSKYCMNVYVRSMNYKDNFVFDCQTFNLAYNKVFERLKKQYGEVVNEGYIRVFVFSLHLYN